MVGRYQNVRPAENITFADALNKYLERVSTTKRPNSESRDWISAKAFIADFGQEISLAAVTSQHLAKYGDLRQKSVSPSTIQKEFTLISHLFNIARQEWGIQVKNPVSEVRRPKIQNSRTRFSPIRKHSGSSIPLQSSRNEKLYSYLLVLMHTEMRPSEAAGLKKWSDVDLDGRLVHLRITKTDMR